MVTIMTCSYCQEYQAYLQAHQAWAEGYRSRVASLTQRSAKNDEYSLIPISLSNGGIQYTDRNGHGYLKVIPQANGEYAYFGTESVIQRLNGRAELDRVGPKLKDRIFSND